MINNSSAHKIILSYDIITLFRNWKKKLDAIDVDFQSRICENIRDKTINHRRYHDRCTYDITR